MGNVQMGGVSYVKMELTGLQQKIFLDRYAEKELDPSKWEEGGLVVAMLTEDPLQPLLRKTITGEVLAKGNGTLTIRDVTNTNVHELPFTNIEYAKEEYPHEMWDRVARALSAVEAPEKQVQVYRDFAYALNDWKLVPGGRVSAGAGTDELTLMNCLAGETIVQTVDGPKRIKDLSGEVDVYSQDGNIRTANFRSFGKQELYLIELENGDRIRATAGHQWLVSKSKGGYERVTTLELKDRRIPIVPVAKPAKNDDYYAGIRHGIVYGDGWTTYKGSEVRLFGEKVAFTEYFEGYHIVPHYDGDYIQVSGMPSDLASLPSERVSASYWYGFIVGLIGTDGSCDSRGSVMIHQADHGALHYMVHFLYKTGFVHTDLRMTRELNPYSGEYAPSFALQIAKSTVTAEDLIKPSHRQKFESSPLPRRTNLTVSFVQQIGIEEEVYCCEEPETHSFVIGAGYLTSNCYVIPSPHDSRGGIMESLEQMTEIMSRGGGVGLNLSSLRPKRAIVKGVRGHSSGSVSWGGLFSYTTGLIEQGGSRRGALMLMIDDWHPDLLSFIRAKTQMGLITNANMSVCVSNAFMHAVKHDLDWPLEFPVTAHPAYDKEWKGNLRDWKAAGYPVEQYGTVRATEVWDEIITSAWKSAEPGVVFMEHANYMSNSWYFAPLICTNPCGEQPLPAWGVCNLSAINLSKFYDPIADDVDWNELGKIVRIGTRLCDNVTQATMYPLEGQAQNQREGERRNGLGTMGLAELLIKLGIRYGSEACSMFLDKLYSFMAKEAYLASADLAEEKGSFKQFELSKFIQSGFMKNLISKFPGVLDALKAKGIRNTTLLTQAPTGSTGTMVGTSTGIEPYFAFEYYRQGRLGTEKQLVPIAQEWKDRHPGEELPGYFTTAQDLAAEDHVRTQAVIQRWTDSAISKTANAPHDFTVADTKRLYELAFDLGCKGVTIYRDGSRDIQVLSTIKEEPKEAPLGLEVAELNKDENAFAPTLQCDIREENGQIIRECH